jgi:Fusaric acid resistance protein-like
MKPSPMSTVRSSRERASQLPPRGWVRAKSCVRAEAFHAVALAFACLASYEITAHALSGVHSVAPSDDHVSGMWAALATIFVYRDTAAASRSAAISRVVATFVSLVLCLVYLALFGFHPLGLAALIVVGSLALAALGRPGDAVTANITTAVVLVIAGIEPHNAWEQPILRMGDTVVGVFVGFTVARSVRHYKQWRRASPGHQVR